jgi:hypothetical protein
MFDRRGKPATLVGIAPRMSTAAARRRKSHPEDDRENGLWIDPSRLPTASKSRVSAFRLPAEIPAMNRFLELADIALGNPKRTLRIERRRNQQ